jgi:hypothetical protein
VAYVFFYLCIEEGRRRKEEGGRDGTLTLLRGSMGWQNVDLPVRFLGGEREEGGIRFEDLYSWITFTFTYFTLCFVGVPGRFFFLCFCVFLFSLSLSLWFRGIMGRWRDGMDGWIGSSIYFFFFFFFFYIC